MALGKVTRDFPVAKSGSQFPVLILLDLSAVSAESIVFSSMKHFLHSSSRMHHTLPGFPLVFLCWFFFLTLEDPRYSPWTSSLSPFTPSVILQSCFKYHLNTGLTFLSLAPTSSPELHTFLTYMLLLYIYLYIFIYFIYLYIHIYINIYITLYTLFTYITYIY